MSSKENQDSDEELDDGVDDCILFSNDINKAKKTEEFKVLQHILYEEDTPYSRALNFKEQGNEQFKKGRMRGALNFYTNGIEIEDNEDKELIKTLHNNRAQVHLKLRNFRKCIEDCEIVLKDDPKNEKSLFRIVKGYIGLDEMTKSINYCNQYLLFHKEESKTRKLFEKMKNQCEVKWRSRRKEKKEIVHQSLQVNEILNKKGIKLSKKNEINQIEKEMYQVDPQTKELFFKVVILYDEFQQSDTIVKFCENSTFLEVLSPMFPIPFGGNERMKDYEIINVKIYFFSLMDQKYHKFGMEETLGNVLRKKNYLLPRNFCPTFHIISKFTENVSFE